MAATTSPEQVARFVVQWTNDDTALVFIAQGDSLCGIGTIDYDTYGRSGMSAALAMISTLSRYLDMPVTVVGNPGV
jgi:hypothetical protein